MTLKWQKLPEEEKEERRKKWGHACKKRKHTFIEIEIKKILESLNIAFIQNHYSSSNNLRFFFDFYLPDFNFIIECNGDYWHANPKIYNPVDYTEVQKINVKRDLVKEKFLKQNKFDFLFLWENDIRKKIEEVKKTIMEKLCLKKP